MDAYLIIVPDTLGLALAVILCFALRRQAAKISVSRLFYALLFADALQMIDDAIIWLVDGRGAPPMFLYTINSLYHMLQAVICCLWVLHALQAVYGGISKQGTVLLCLPLVVQVVMLVTNMSNGFIFYFTESGLYKRGVLWGASVGIFYVLYVTGVLLHAILFSKTPERKRTAQYFALYTALPVASAVVQLRFYGLSLIWPFTMVALFMVYLNLQQEAVHRQTVQALQNAEALARVEAELAQNRIAITLSQIQPHFLYNVLCVIQDLCHGKAPQAEAATEQFSEFLRGNLDSLSTQQLVPFSRELEHTKSYLALEKLRFGARLTVRYHIETTSFRLPTLTLQPIVENAVRHGAMTVPEGGAVDISVVETPQAYCIRVLDNGKNFCPPPKTQDASSGRLHMGIDNVRSRLKSQCDGTFTQRATPEGTLAEMMIFKEEAQ